MVSVNRILLVMALALSILMVGACAPGGSKYPEKPVTLIIPYAAGGTTDLAGRALVEAAKPHFAQPFAVVNRAGGNGSVGVSEAIQAKPDGYTLAMGAITSAVLQPQLSELPYKGPADYTPVIKMMNSAAVLVVGGDAPWGSVKEMLDAARANPGKLRIGQGAAVGSTYQMIIEMLKDKAGVNMTHVPNGSGAEAITALLGGHVEAAVMGITPLAGQVKAGKLKLLATFEEKRNPQYPDTPTAREAGYDITMGAYYFILSAKGTPGGVVQTLHDALKKAVESESFKKFCSDSGNVVDYKGPADLKQELERDFTLFSDLLKKVELK